MRRVLHHALPAKLVYGLGGGADKHLKKFVVAVIRVIGHFNFRGIFSERADILNGCAQLVLKITADFTRPADVERALVRVVRDAGLLALQTVRIGQRFDIEVFEPRPQGLLNLFQAHAFAQKNRAVYVYFRSHEHPNVTGPRNQRGRGAL